MIGLRPFSLDELAALEITQEGAMQDECQVLIFSSGSTNDLGLPIPAFTPGATFSCGYNPDAKGEAMGATQVGEKLAKVRLPLSAEGSIDVKDRVKITKRFGVVLSPEPTFEIVGLPERGPSGLVLRLRLVTDGSG